MAFLFALPATSHQAIGGSAAAQPVSGRFDAVVGAMRRDLEKRWRRLKLHLDIIDGMAATGQNLTFVDKCQRLLAINHLTFGELTSAGAAIA